VAPYNIESGSQTQTQTPTATPSVSTPTPSVSTPTPSVSTAIPSASTSTPSPTPTTSSNNGHNSTLSVKSKYTYKGKYAGNVQGSYNRVTKLDKCVTTPVTINSPVGPMSEEVSMVFRGPMEISDIAVYTSQAGDAAWSRVSSYNSASRSADNIVFMSNHNIDYSGLNQHGPQGFSSADGKNISQTATVFGGYLAEASDTSKIGGGPGVQTGAEINIMTSKQCNGDCLGFAGPNDYHGWDGGKKIFVTRVKMPQGTSPNQPAIWMLNAQTMHSGQYGCNCRGMGSVGGCGELDIAEVIETNTKKDCVTTHYYFYDGSVLSEKGDNFAPRPFNEFTVYVTIIDDSGEGLIKIVEINNFDFSLKALEDALFSQLVDA